MVKFSKSLLDAVQFLSSMLSVDSCLSSFISPGSVSQTGCTLESPGELCQNLDPGAPAIGIPITQVNMELGISGFLEDSPRLLL